MTFFTSACFEMASTQDLKDVIKETLDNHGSLAQIKARIRAEVFNALDDRSETKPPLSNENMIINELIREYLEFNKYQYTASVLVAESGQPKEPLNREFLARELHVREDRNSSSVPLLYGIVSNYLKQNNRPPPNRATSPQLPQPRGVFLDQLEREMGGADTEQAFIVMGGKR